MRIYKVYELKLQAFNVERETNLFYFIERHEPAFGYCKRIIKKLACLTPKEAVQEALNGRRTMRGAFIERLVKIAAEIETLKSLQRAII